MDVVLQGYAVFRAACTPLYELILRIPVIKSGLRQFYPVLLECPCDRLGEWGNRMHQVHMRLVPFHPRGGRGHLLHCRVIFRGVLVAVGTQIEFHQLGQLAQRRGHVTPETEVADVYQRHPSVGMELHARLVTPEVRILVEVPVRPLRVFLAAIVPVRTVEGFPYFLESIVVSDILI